MRKRIVPKTQDLKIDAPKTATPRIVRANVNRHTTPSENFVSLYANDAQVQLSPWDIRLILGIIEDQPNAERDAVSVKLIGEVRMSPQFAKRLAIVLIQQLKLYEESIGAIPLPKD